MKYIATGVMAAILLIAAALPARADLIATVDATNPLAFFPLQQASGSSTVNGYTSTAQNGASVVPSNGGPQPSAISLNGLNSSSPEQVATSLSGGISGAGSIMAWVNLASLNSGNTMYIAGESQSGNDFDLQFVGNSSTLENLCFYSDAGTSTCATLGASSLLNTWNMVTATYNGTTHEQDVYVNGSLVASNSNGTSGSKTNVFNIGYSTVFGNRDLNGLISDVGVWDSQLSATQVATIYAAGTAIGVPETSTLTLLAVGLLGLGLSRRWAR